MGKRMLCFLVFGVAFAIAAVPATDAKKPDFSGVWKYIPEKSKLQIPAPDSAVFHIDHHEPLFKMSRTFIEKGVNETWGIDLTTDGKEVVQEGSGRTLRVRLYWDGDDLIFDSVIILKDRQATNVVRYHLSGGGRTCTATESFRGPIMKYDNVWVFTRE